MDSRRLNEQTPQKIEQVLTELVGTHILPVDVRERFELYLALGKLNDVTLEAAKLALIRNSKQEAETSDFAELITLSHGLQVVVLMLLIHRDERALVSEFERSLEHTMEAVLYEENRQGLEIAGRECGEEFVLGNNGDEMERQDGPYKIHKEYPRLNGFDDLLQKHQDLARQASLILTPRDQDALWSDRQPEHTPVTLRERLQSTNQQIYEMLGERETLHQGWTSVIDGNNDNNYAEALIAGAPLPDGGQGLVECMKVLRRIRPEVIYGKTERLATMLTKDIPREQQELVGRFLDMVSERYADRPLLVFGTALVMRNQKYSLSDASMSQALDLVEAAIDKVIGRNDGRA